MQRPHGVAEVGDEAGPGFGGFDGRVSAVHAEWPSDTSTPRVAQGGDGVEGAGQLGGEGQDAHEVAERVEPGQVDAAAHELGPVRPGNSQEGALEMGPGDVRTSPGRPAGRLGDPAPARLSRASSGAVTMVGHHVVTPWASRARSRASQSGAGGAGHVDGTDPVDLEVDETRRQHHVGHRAACGPDLDDRARPRRRPRRLATGPADVSTVDALTTVSPRAPPGGPVGTPVGARWRRCRFVAWARESYGIAVADPQVQVPPNCDLTLGMVCVDKSEPGTTVWQMPADERFTNPVGVLQGRVPGRVL